MGALMLAIIYLSFISLGLPDSLIGSGWSVMREELNVPISYAGIVTMIISCCTIFSSLFSDRLTSKLGTGLVTAISVLLTAVALLGFSLSTRFWHLCLWAVPYGLGAGAVDAALNNYVALHYKSRHMSWLHCFWGFGAMISPYIMSYALTGSSGWNGGYRTVSIIQFGLTAALFLTLKLWKKPQEAAENRGEEGAPKKSRSLLEIFKIDGVPLVLLSFFAYCAAEATAMLWTSSYLLEYRGLSEQTASRCASLFFIGITVGRFLGGFITEKLGDKLLVRIGTAVMLVGVALVLIPFESNAFSIVGFVVFGFGCAPVYPCIIHSTPERFGEDNSQAIIGIQMASAYTGSTFMPPVFGLLAQYVDIALLPVYLLLFTVLLLVLTECLNAKMKQKERAPLEKLS